MKRYLTINGDRYLIRGPFTAPQVRQRHADFLRKYPDSTLPLDRWAVERGAVYFRVPNPRRTP
jgi:hypothetical protein